MHGSYHKIQEETFYRLIESIKIAQRPKYQSRNVPTCYCCQAEFGFLLGSYTCYKCGTAVCSACSSYFITLPEYAFYDRVRCCRSCLEQVFRGMKMKQIDREEGFKRAD